MGEQQPAETLPSRNSILTSARSAERKAENAVRAHLEEVDKRVELGAEVARLAARVSDLERVVAQFHADVDAHLARVLGALPRRARRRLERALASDDPPPAV